MTGGNHWNYHNPSLWLENIKARTMGLWFMRKRICLRGTNSQNLEGLFDASPLLLKVYQLVQSFMGMVWKPEGEWLEEWLS